MEEYLRERERLIAEDRSRRVDASAFGSAGDEERKADEIMRRIRTEENEIVWGPDAPPIPGSMHVFPGMEFLTGELIRYFWWFGGVLMSVDSTRDYCEDEALPGCFEGGILCSHYVYILTLALQMPKGALLHSHLDATVNARVLLRIALKHRSIHVRSSVLLTEDTLPAALPEFSPLPQDEWTELASLTNSVYEPGQWVPLAKARETFDPSLGGPEGFDEWVVRALTINPSEAYVTHNTTAKVRNPSSGVPGPCSRVSRRFGRSLARRLPLHGCVSTCTHSSMASVY